MAIDSSSDESGLLFYSGGTVCSDGFNDNSTMAICRLMGYIGASEWTVGELYDFQSDHPVGLTNVVCSSGSWDSCVSQPNVNCQHSADVHLACEVGRKSILLKLNNKLLKPK